MIEKLVIAVGLMLFSISSFACIELSNSQKVCIGDEVSAAETMFFGSGAKVTGLNYADRTAVVEVALNVYVDSRRVFVVKVEELYVARTGECVENVCVGDSVVALNKAPEPKAVLYGEALDTRYRSYIFSKESSARVSGVNKASKSVSIRMNPNYAIDSDKEFIGKAKEVSVGAAE